MPATDAWGRIGYALRRANAPALTRAYELRPYSDNDMPWITGSRAAEVLSGTVALWTYGSQPVVDPVTMGWGACCGRRARGTYV